MKGIVVSHAVLFIGAALGSLIGLPVIQSFPNQILGVAEGTNFEDNTRNLEQAISDKCALHRESSPQNPAPRKEQFSAYRLDEIRLEEADSGDGTNVTFESSGQTRYFVSSCDFNSESISFDAESNPAKEYELGVSCQNCDQEPPLLKLSSTEVG